MIRLVRKSRFAHRNNVVNPDCGADTESPKLERAERSSHKPFNQDARACQPVLPLRSTAQKMRARPPLS